MVKVRNGYRTLRRRTVRRWTLRYGGGRYGGAFQFRVDATVEPPDIHELPWPLRRSYGETTTLTLSLILSLTLTLSTLTITPTRRSVHGNVSIWWLRRRVHPKLKSSAVVSSPVPSSAVVSTAVPSSAAASGPRI